MQNKMNLC